MAKAKILIAEDERIVAADIQRSLQGMGYAVCGIVSSGEEAVNDAAELRPDLVLMDIVLEGEQDGIEAANLIRAHLNIPVVYLTAYRRRELLSGPKPLIPVVILSSHLMTKSCGAP